MNARALAAWSLASLVVVMAVSNPVYRALVVLAALNVIVAGRREGVKRGPLLLTLGVALALATAFNTVLSHSGAHVLARFPDWIPVFGGPLTAEGMVYGVGVGLGIAAAVLVVAPLSLCLEPDQLVSALPALLHRTGAALGAAFNLLPAMVRSVTAIAEAQRLRGLPVGLRGVRWVLLPATLTALDDSLQLAESMEARAYGSGPRTSFAESPWRRRDGFIAVLSVAAAGLFVALHSGGLVSDWYPYPTLTAPAVNAAGAGACAVLVLPALLWSSRTSSA